MPDEPLKDLDVVVVLRYRPISTTLWALTMLAIFVVALYGIFGIRGGPIEYLRMRTMTWPMVLVGYAAIGFGIWMVWITLWRIAFRGGMAAWIQGGQFRALFVAVKLDELEQVNLVNNVGIGIAASNVLEFQLKSGRKKHLATILFMGTPQEILAKVRHSISTQ